MASKVVPRNEELALHSNDRAALRSELATYALSSKTVGERQGGITEEVTAALEADIAPELK